MTARHVIFGCTKLRLVRQGGAAEGARLLFSHPSGDLAIIEDGVGGPPLQFADRSPSADEDGYAVGFPQGGVGAVHFYLLGRSRLQMRGWMTGAAPTLSWAEESRFPPQLAGLGGLSGGPMVDDEGRLLGIVVTATTRRGRADSIAPEMLDEARKTYFPNVGAKARPLSQVAQGREQLEQIAWAIVRERRVGLVYCER
jgi:S1-C subfamily serine protease